MSATIKPFSSNSETIEDVGIHAAEIHKTGSQDLSVFS